MIFSKLNVKIVPIGNLDEKFLFDFKEEFQKLIYDAVGFDVDCFFNNPHNPDKSSEDKVLQHRIPSTAYNTHMGKYNTRPLFLFGKKIKEDTVKRPKSSALLKILLLTDFDIYREGYGGILFGEAEKGGEIVIVSTANLKDSHKDPNLKKDEALKEALHVFGYLFGLEACNTPGCVMNIAKDVKDIDKRNKAYCKDCLDKLFS
jgi:predicted Zn-dependent protease